VLGVLPLGVVGVLPLGVVVVLLGLGPTTLSGSGGVTGVPSLRTTGPPVEIASGAGKWSVALSQAKYSEGVMFMSVLTTDRTRKASCSSRKGPGRRGSCGVPDRWVPRPVEELGAGAAADGAEPVADGLTVVGLVAGSGLLAGSGAGGAVTTWGVTT
jgi:hypothetical protein